MTKKGLLTEFSSVELPDKRYENNFKSIVEALHEGLGLSYSRALGERLRKSAWRLFSTELMDLQSTHRQNALLRCEEQDIVLAVEDTMDVNYTFHKSKSGLGRLGGSSNQKAYGINVHSVMLLNHIGIPLGLIHQRMWSPNENHKGKKRRIIPIEDKESYKWILSLEQLNTLWQDKAGKKVIKISDRESDFYELYEYERSPDIELLHRVKYRNRKIIYNEQTQYLKDVLNQLPPLGCGEVKIEKNKDTEARIAKVNYYATAIKIPPSGNVGKGKILEMNLVWVKEDNHKTDALEWILMTTLPIETLEEVLQIVKYYTYRWIIERFHYILKQTLFIEHIQIDDLNRLFNALQIYAVIAWHVLWLHRLGLLDSQHPAYEYFDEQSIEVLQNVTNENIQTCADFVRVVASLAGFKTTKQQPHPGEKTLALALIRFFAVFKGFMKAKQIYATG